MPGEADRIRAELERRRREIPPDFYARWRPENLFSRHGQERALLAGLRRAGLLPLTHSRVLEVGCGDGDWLTIFLEFGGRVDLLAGIDLDDDRVASARNRLGGADLRSGDACSLPWPDESFDIVAQSTVFSSILDETMRREVAAEMYRVLRPGGAVVWYDFFVDNPGNPNVRGVRWREVVRLFPGCRGTASRTTLAPPLARRVVPRSWQLATMLEALKLLDTHFLGVLVKEPGRGRRAMPAESGERTSREG